MEQFTIESFQQDFDNLLSRVENGEHIKIINEEGQIAVIVPVDDDFIKIHTDHEEGS
jgi:antitoxin (DNA-binding transcriptional repressor) of toxin-antitoxin stability system